MSKPTKVIPSLCRGYLLSSKTTSYTSRDVILYALSLGLSHADPLSTPDLQFTYEFSQHFACLPTFPVVLPSFDDVFQGLNDCPGMPAFNPMMLLHGEQKIDFGQQEVQGRRGGGGGGGGKRMEGEGGGECDTTTVLPVEGCVSVESRIRDVKDKGKGALVVVETEGKEEEEEEGQHVRVLFRLFMSMYIRGIGGFGEDEGTALAEEEDMFDRKVKKPSRKPDLAVHRNTFPSQALLYRLNGDKNPLHADPAMAQMGGFDRPILHGLCSYGIAVHTVVRHVCANDPSRVRSAAGRFVSPVFPGDALSVRMWKEEEEEGRSAVVVFDVVNVRSGKLCIDNGVVRITTTTTEEGGGGGSTFHAKL
eukprot:GHVS01038222.1.p1 GENE.GHVS01038222.1~~GHVS01038222.1.p1  ORF type:complete len:363 (-),score=101.62 GHVS01038222.1:533-1621(-)